MTSYEALVNTLIAARQELHMSQRTLARRLGVGMFTMKAWEGGYRVPRGEKLFKWVYHLGLQINLSHRDDVSTDQDTNAA